ncbi:MAG: UDP-glucose 4-epimerase GalE [Treponema sp.]|jgi:UDP-glucose 4-epimerase|nr:UDP-glucose 4-epimerase GalE [Treponema sp.]
MNVLIVGGAGYIGSHVAREFLDQGHRVTVYDNLSSGLESNLYPEAGFIKGDILNYEELKSAMKGSFDALIHLAAFKAAGESMLNPQKYSVNNITGSLNIINAAVECGIRNIVFSSSAAVFGEPEYLPIDEKHPTNPENYYGFTKLEIESFLRWYEKLKGIRFAALRYFNAAGYDVKGRMMGMEKNPANLLPVVMEVACGMRAEIQVFGSDYETPDGTGVRDYVHVNDLAVGHVSALDYIVNNEKSLIVNLGSEVGISVMEIIEAARRITGKPIPAKIVDRRPGDPAKLTATSKMAHELLGWTAQHSDIDTLIRTSWNVYSKNMGL